MQNLKCIFQAMIKPSLLCMFFLLALTSVAQQRYELKWKNVETLEFDFPKEDYTSDSIFFISEASFISINFT